MKTESNYLGVANYSETTYEFECDIDWIEYQDRPLSARRRFMWGEVDALFLIAPQSQDFDYLCGWHSQTEKLIKESESLILEFGEF